jgi:hypothetical protein
MLPAFVGRRPCGCVAQVVVGTDKTAEQLSRDGLKFEELGEALESTRCELHAKPKPARRSLIKPEPREREAEA